MSTDNLFTFVQQGFRVTLGATASFMESLQDSQKWDENVHKLQTDWEGLTQEFEKKGEETETEARNFVDSVLNQPSDSQNGSTTETSPSSSLTSTTTKTEGDDLQGELQELTAEIAALRSELEKSRSEGESE